MVFPKWQRSQMLKWASGMPRSLISLITNIAPAQVYTEQSYLNKGACMPCGQLKRPRWSLALLMSLNREPCVEGVVCGTSQGARLDPALAAVLSSGGRLWSSTVSRVPSHHFQGVTQDEKSGGLQDQAEFCFASLLILN